MGLPVQNVLDVFMAGQIALGSAVGLNHKNQLYFPNNLFLRFSALLWKK